MVMMRRTRRRRTRRRRTRRRRTRRRRVRRRRRKIMLGVMMKDNHYVCQTV